MKLPVKTNDSVTVLGLDTKGEVVQRMRYYWSGTMPIAEWIEAIQLNFIAFSSSTVDDIALTS